MALWVKAPHKKLLPSLIFGGHRHYGIRDIMFLAVELDSISVRDNWRMQDPVFAVMTFARFMTLP